MNISFLVRDKVFKSATTEIDGIIKILRTRRDGHLIVGTNPELWRASECDELINILKARKRELSDVYYKEQKGGK